MVVAVPTTLPSASATKQPPGLCRIKQRQSAAVWFQPEMAFSRRPAGMSSTVIMRMCITKSSRRIVNCVGEYRKAEGVHFAEPDLDRRPNTTRRSAERAFGRRGSGHAGASRGYSDFGSGREDGAHLGAHGKARVG